MGNQHTKSENSFDARRRTVLNHSQRNPSRTVDPIEVEEPTPGVHNFSTSAEKKHFAPDPNSKYGNGLNNTQENSFGPVAPIQVKTTSGVHNFSQLEKRSHIVPNSNLRHEIDLDNSRETSSGSVELIEAKKSTSGFHNSSQLEKRSHIVPNSNLRHGIDLDNSRETSSGSVELIEAKKSTSGVHNFSQLAKKSHLAPNFNPRYGIGLDNSRETSSGSVELIEVRKSTSGVHSSSHLASNSNPRYGTGNFLRPSFRSVKPVQMKKTTSGVHNYHQRAKKKKRHLATNSSPRYGTGLTNCQRNSFGSVDSIEVKKTTSDVHDLSQMVKKSHLAPNSNPKYETDLNNSRRNSFESVEPIEVKKPTSGVHNSYQLLRKSHLAPDSYKYGTVSMNSQGNSPIEAKEPTSEVHEKSHIAPDTYQQIDKNQKQNKISTMSELNILTDMQEVCFSLSSIEKRVENIRFSASQQNVLTELLGTAQNFIKLINHSLDSQRRSSTPNSVGSVHQQNTNTSEALRKISNSSSVISEVDAKITSQCDTSVLPGILNELKEENPEKAGSEMNEVVIKSVIRDSSTFGTKVHNESEAFTRKPRLLQMRIIQSYMQKLRIDRVEDEEAVIEKLTEFKSFLSKPLENSSKGIRRLTRKMLLNIENVLSKLLESRMQKEKILKGKYEDVHNNLKCLEVNVKLCNTFNSDSCEMISRKLSLFEKYLPANELIEQSDREDLMKMLQLISESFRKKVLITEITNTQQSEMIQPIANDIICGKNSRDEIKLQQIANRRDEKMNSEIESKGTTDKDTECDVVQVAQSNSVRKKILAASSKMQTKKLDGEVHILMPEAEGSGITIHFTNRNDIQIDPLEQLMTIKETNFSQNVFDEVEKKVNAAMAKVTFSLKYDSTEECRLLEKEILVQYETLNILEFDTEEKSKRKCDINEKILNMLNDLDQHIRALAEIKDIEIVLKDFGKKIEKDDENYSSSLKILLNNLRRRLPQISSQSSERRRRLKQCDDIIQSYLDEIDGKPKYYYFSSII